MNAVKILPHYTYADYSKWEGRWEVIGGIPFAMSPAPTPKHQWLVANAISEFRTAIKKKHCTQCRVYDFIDVIIEDDNVLQPDCSVVCNPITKKFLDFPPELVVEVLSPATALKDRHSKFALYEKFAIKYYLIVDEEKEEVEVYCLENSRYSLKETPGTSPFTFFLMDGCEIDVDLNEIWE